MKDAGEAPLPTRIPHWRQVLDQGVVTQDIIDFPYEGAGTDDDPFVVNWIPNDPRNPQLYSPLRKWSITGAVSIATLAVALISSAYTGGATQIMVEFNSSQIVVILGVSLFVLGFAVGPLMWAPMSELFGRQYLFVTTYCALTAFNAGCAGAPNMWSLIIMRFLAGTFGASPLTNSGGIIADMFGANERGLAMGFFAIAPFLGPVLGPIIGGFLGNAEGWRWVQGFLAIFSGAVWILGSLYIPETYPPVLLRKRAARLSKLSGKVYVSRLDRDQGRTSVGEAFVTSLQRPWVLLFREPIVLLLSIYMAIVYGTLYMLFGAFPIVYQQHRGWNEGIGGLSFLGVLVGMLFATVLNLFDNKRYAKVSAAHGGFAPPETRLPVVMIGGIAIPIGLFWFAWTNDPSVHWMASISAGVPFGFGMVLVFLGLMNYLIDSYTIYAASVLAANSVLRSLFGAAFPLFTRYMYDDLGIHWASSVPAFLAVACVPFPFLFYKYGAQIRTKCKYAAEADQFMRKIQAMAAQTQGQGGDQAVELPTEEPPMLDEKEVEAERERHERLAREGSAIYEDQDDTEGGRTSSESSREPLGHSSSRTRTRSRVSSTASGPAPSFVSEYDGNPYDIDRVNTRTSMASAKAKKSKSRN